MNSKLRWKVDEINKTDTDSMVGRVGLKPPTAGNSTEPLMHFLIMGEGGEGRKERGGRRRVAKHPLSLSVWLRH
jgi:hypothetical protein